MRFGGILTLQNEAVGLSGHPIAEGGDALSLDIIGIFVTLLGVAIACIAFGYQLGKDINKRK